MADLPQMVEHNLGYAYKLLTSYRWYEGLDQDQRHALPTYTDPANISIMTGERYCRFLVINGEDQGPAWWACGAVKSTTKNCRDHVRTHQWAGQAINHQPEGMVTLAQWHHIRDWFTSLYRQARLLNPGAFPAVAGLEGPLNLADLERLGADGNVLDA